MPLLLLAENTYLQTSEEAERKCINQVLNLLSNPTASPLSVTLTHKALSMMALDPVALNNFEDERIRNAAIPRTDSDFFSLGQYYEFIERDWQQAEQAYRSTLRINPLHRGAHIQLYRPN